MIFVGVKVLVRGRGQGLDRRGISSLGQEGRVEPRGSEESGFIAGIWKEMKELDNTVPL